MPFYRDRKDTTDPSTSTPNPTRKLEHTPANKPRPRQRNSPPHSAVANAQALPDLDLVVGWLAVVEGPGRGLTFPLRYGINIIARGLNAHVRLDYGDLDIAAEHHAAIIYTAKARRFYFQPQAKTHRSGVNSRLLKDPVELCGNETLLVGRTRLKFVPLCGPFFDWRG